MKAIKFKHCNITYAENQPQYNPLPGLKLDTKEGEFIACYKMNFWERLKVLFTGKVWVSFMTFNNPLTPHFITVNRKDVYSHIDDKKGLFE